MDLFSLAAKLTLDSSDYNKGIGQAESMMSKVADGAKKVGTVMAGALTTAAGAVAGLTKKAVEAYAEFEQLEGGVETLFGEKAAKTVMENAEKAFETAGMSANEYMQTVTSFSASLIQSTGRGAQTDVDALKASLDDEYTATKRSLEDQYAARKAYWDEQIKLSKNKKTKETLKAERDGELRDLKRQNEDTLAEMKKHNKELIAEAEAANQTSVNSEESLARAAELADQAVIDMSDNANKMGTDITAIQNAYSGFAKGNYTMLDNLKLGYGGTKEEMERLLQNAEKLTGKKYDLSSFADITEAIHAIQVKMEITGTTAEEGSKTVSGSANAMKAAWQNMLVTFADPNGNTKKATQNLVKTAKTFWKNLSPVITQAISGIGDFLSEVAPMIGEQLPEIIAEITPKLLSAGSSLVSGLVKGVFTAIKNVKWPTWSDVRNTVTTAWNKIKNAVSDLGGLIFGKNEDGTVNWPDWEDIKEAAKKLWNKIKEFASNLGGLIFGKNEDGTVNYPKWDGEDGVKAKLQKFWDTMIEWASKLTGLELGNITSVSDAIDKIWTSWKTVKENIEGAAIKFVTYFFGDSVDPNTVASVIKTIGDVLVAIGVALATYYTVAKVQGIIDFFKNLQLLGNTSKIGLILSLVSAGLMLIVENWDDKIKPALDTALTWLDENIFTPVGDFFTNLQTWFNDTIRNIKRILGLDWNERQGEGLLTRGEADELSADYLDAQQAYSDWEKNDKLSEFYANLQKKMEEAGFSADEVAEALEKVKDIKDYKEMSEFLDALTDSKTKAEELKSAVEAVPTDIDITAHVNVDDPNGVLGGSVSTSGEKIYRDRRRNNNDDGSHVFNNAKGNWNVPYDDFLTNLHRGEMVLTASQARKYREGNSSSDFSGMFDIVRDAIREGMTGVNVNSYLNGNSITDDVSRNTGRQLKARRFRG